MRFKTAILGGAAALLLGTGLTGVALAEAPTPTVTPSASPVAAPAETSTKAPESDCASAKKEQKENPPCPAAPRAAEPNYTG